MALLRKRDVNETGKVLSLPINSILPNPNQPRCQFSPDALRELSDSIRELGILQPLSVRCVDGAWELIAGERRWRAAQLAGLTHVPCIVVEADETQSALFALVENLQRRDLDFLEESLGLARLIDTYHLTQEECARRVGKSQSAIANKLRLLKLSPQALSLLRDSGFSERHARALLRLEGAAAQDQAAQWVVDHDLTVAKTEEYVEHLLTQASRAAKRRPTFILKDVRLFLNTLDRGLSMIRSAGINAQYDRDDTADAILLTIRIPKNG